MTLNLQVRTGSRNSVIMLRVPKSRKHTSKPISSHHGPHCSTFTSFHMLIKKLKSDPTLLISFKILTLCVCVYLKKKKIKDFFDSHRHSQFRLTHRRKFLRQIHFGVVINHRVVVDPCLKKTLLNTRQHLFEDAG